MASEDVFAAFLGEVKELSEKAEAKKNKEKSTNEGEANAAGPDPSGQPSPSAQRTCAPTIQAGPRVVKSRAAVTNTGKQNDAQRNSDTLDPIQSMMNRDFQKVSWTIPSFFQSTFFRLPFYSPSLKWFRDLE